MVEPLSGMLERRSDNIPFAAKVRWVLGGRGLQTSLCPYYPPDPVPTWARGKLKVSECSGFESRGALLS